MLPTLKSKKNIAEEIAAQYKQYIELGVLRAGEKLPSCRELAVSLKINPNTAQVGYTLLEKEGLIVTLPQKGSYVAERPGELGDKAHLITEATNQIALLKTAGLTKNELQDILNSTYIMEETL